MQDPTRGWFNLAPLQTPFTGPWKHANPTIQALTNERFQAQKQCKQDSTSVVFCVGQR